MLAAPPTVPCTVAGAALSTEHFPRGDVWTARTARRAGVHESEDSIGFGEKVSSPGPFARARTVRFSCNKQHPWAKKGSID